MAAKIWSVVCMAALYPGHQSTHLHAVQPQPSQGYTPQSVLAIAWVETWPAIGGTRHSRAQLYVGMGMFMAGGAIILIF